MKKLLLLIVGIGVSCVLSFSQNVAINSTGFAPNASSMLDVSSTNKGILLPRVALTASNSALPITSPADALLIYNTATAGVAPNNVVPGYYFWNVADSKWKWLFSGNLPNIPGNVEYWIRPTGMNYIRPEYNSAIKVHDDGETRGIEYIGSTNEIAGYFEIQNSTNGASAVQGFSNVLGNQTYAHLGFNGIYNYASQGIDGSAVYAYVEDPDRTAGFFRTTGNATMAANICYSDMWIPSYNYVESSAAGYNPSASYCQLDVNAAIGAFYQTALMTLSQNNSTGTNGISVGGRFQADGANQSAFGVYGWANTDGSAAYAMGGYFYAQSTWWGDAAYAYVADENSLRKITGTNAVSEIIPTEKHGRITMTCPEAPEYWYYDYGTVQLIDGHAHVDLDPILVDIIVVNNDNPLKVFLQDNMINSNGIAVINKTAIGFDLVEKNGGNNSGEIDYQIVAKPKTLYGEGRFVQAPGPAYIKPESEPDAAKAKNQRNRENIYTWPPDWKVYNYNPEDYIEIGDVIPAGPHAGKVKLGNGKYGDYVPANRKELNPKEK